MYQASLAKLFSPSTPANPSHPTAPSPGLFGPPASQRGDATQLPTSQHLPDELGPALFQKALPVCLHPGEAPELGLLRMEPPQWSLLWVVSFFPDAECCSDAKTPSRLHGFGKHLGVKELVPFTPSLIQSIREGNRCWEKQEKSQKLSQELFPPNTWIKTTLLGALQVRQRRHKGNPSQSSR